MKKRYSSFRPLFSQLIAFFFIKEDLIAFVSSRTNAKESFDDILADDSIDWTGTKSKNFHKRCIYSFANVGNFLYDAHSKLILIASR